MEQHRKAASKVLTGFIISYGISILSGILMGVWLIDGGAELIGSIVESAVDDGDVMAVSQTVSIIQGSLILILISVIATVGQIVGITLSYVGMRNLSVGLDEIGTRGARNMTTSMLLSLIAICIGLLNWVVVFSAVIAGICSLVAIIMMIVGASTLRHSESLNEMGRSGAKSVYVAYLLSAISIAAIIIPIIGWLAIPVLAIISMIKNLSGWSKIRRSFIQ